MKKIVCIVVVMAFVITQFSCIKEAFKVYYFPKTHFLALDHDPYTGNPLPDTTSFLLLTGPIGDDLIMSCRTIYKNRMTGLILSTGHSTIDNLPDDRIFFGPDEVRVPLKFGSVITTSPDSLRFKADSIIAGRQYVILRRRNNPASPEKDYFVIETLSATQ
ncbi:MAG: hypothetical protein ABIO57_03845 [Candidatus Paceibacterota bacterium]